MELLPDFGSSLAIDGKALHSFANRCSDKKADGRRDTDGSWAVKAYKGVNADGTLWEEAISWFGYRLHLIVDSKYELPVHYRLTRASNSEVKKAHKMIDDLAELHPNVLQRCDEFTADRGCDDSK